MATPLKLNVEALEFDEIRNDNSGPHKFQSKKSKWSEIFSFLKPQPIAEDPPNFIFVPETYNEDDYLNMLVMQDFLQPNSTMTFEEAVGRVVDVYANYGHDIRSFGTFCLTISEQIPYSHPSQSKLTRLVWLLGRSPERLEKIKLLVC
jgi:hypothetical protein